jgi:hypothetical protein
MLVCAPQRAQYFICRDKADPQDGQYITRFPLFQIASLINAAPNLYFLTNAPVRQAIWSCVQ